MWIRFRSESEALNWAEHGPNVASPQPDLIILDRQLRYSRETTDREPSGAEPRGSGCCVLKALRSTTWGDETPVVLWSVIDDGLDMADSRLYRFKNLGNSTRLYSAVRSLLIAEGMSSPIRPNRLSAGRAFRVLDRARPPPSLGHSSSWVVSQDGLEARGVGPWSADH